MSVINKRGVFKNEKVDFKQMYPDIGDVPKLGGSGVPKLGGKGVPQFVGMGDEKVGSGIEEPMYAGG